MELSDIRQKIDEIDDELISLFIDRMKLSKDIGKYKKENNLPILNKTREREILKKVTEKNIDFEEYSHKLFTTLFELSKAYQADIFHNHGKLAGEIKDSVLEVGSLFPETGVIACQGVEGAYSQIASDHIFPRGNIVYFKTFESVFDAVESGFCQYGVLPIENSSNGSVKAVYELLKERNLNIIRSTKLFIKHELYVKEGVSFEDIKEIYSHEQALGQCSDFIKSLGDEVKIIPCANTAVAAKMVSESDDRYVAAISSNACGKLYGLKALDKEIQNSDNNYTRFICISKEKKVYPGANRISVILASEHKPGALYDILSQITYAGINLYKLESSPIVGQDFEFLFIFEMDASVTDEKTVRLLENLNNSCPYFKYLGNYLEA